MKPRRKRGFPLDNDPPTLLLCLVNGLKLHDISKTFLRARLAKRYENLIYTYQKERRRSGH